MFTSERSYQRSIKQPVYVHMASVYVQSPEEIWTHEYTRDCHVQNMYVHVAYT